MYMCTSDGHSEYWQYLENLQENSPSRRGGGERSERVRYFIILYKCTQHQWGGGPDRDTTAGGGWGGGVF